MICNTTPQCFDCSTLAEVIWKYKHVSFFALSIRMLQLSLTNTKKVDLITPVLRSWHWLPVSQRIDFNIGLLSPITFLIYWYVVNHPDPVVVWDGSALSPVSQPNMEKSAFSLNAPHVWDKLSVQEISWCISLLLSFICFFIILYVALQCQIPHDTRSAFSTNFET